MGLVPTLSGPYAKINMEEISSGENPFRKLKSLGHYRIEKQIGHGGMGYVFKAVDVRKAETVAIKVMSPDFLMNESMVERFKREASLLVKLQHPNIVKLIDVSMEGEFRYYVMELVSGRSIAEEIKKGPLPMNEIAGIAWQASDALGTAHEAGIIHRDIKPANIMRDKAGTIKLTDFGIARVIGLSGGTTAGKAVGTPAYMSPEQVLGKEPGTASDIYSFGVVLYEMLTGRVPFESSNPLDVMRKHVYEDPVSPKKLNHEIPDVFSQLVMKMLRKKRNERTNNIKVFQSRLQDCVRFMHGDFVTSTVRMEIENRTAREQKLRFVKFGILICIMISIAFFVMKSCSDLTSLLVKNISAWKKSESTK